VIVDICSVVKELVENALDASATSLEIRFKNNGLNSIEILDNGAGIAPEDFDSLALKHYTSKLAKYDDLTSLTTFGFRGEALSSLCALSRLSVITSRASDAPKGTKLEFETSGRVKSKIVVASQRGTTVTVEDIFHNLPVRRRELEKNIKREYGKVLGLLHAYACISTGVRFTVSNVPSKGKKVVVFSTKSNPTTRENIANVYGAKTLLALATLDLRLDIHPTTASTQTARNGGTQGDTGTKEVRLKGHISRPVVGEGRQTPDRQMFFVNARPCSLPQVSKAINEVYRSYNVTQSPFIFANLELDTNAYDVNVSPDKRTILLHDQTALLEALKASLNELFESQDQTVPQAATPIVKRLPSFRPLRVAMPPACVKEGSDESEDEASSQTDNGAPSPANMIRRTVEGAVESREDVIKAAIATLAAKKRREAQAVAQELRNSDAQQEGGYRINENVTQGAGTAATESIIEQPQLPRSVQDFNSRMGVDMPAHEHEKLSATLFENDNREEEAYPPAAATPEYHIPSVSNTPQKKSSGVVPNAFDRMRPKRTPQGVATVTIGNQTTSMTLGAPEAKKRRIHTPKLTTNGHRIAQSNQGFASSLKAFTAPSTTVGDSDEEVEEDGEPSQQNPTAKNAAKSKLGPPADVLASAMIATTTPMDSDMIDTLGESAQEEPNASLFLASNGTSDDEYIDEAEKKTREEARIAKMIEVVEERSARPTSDNVKRAANALKGRIRKDSTLQLMQYLETSVEGVARGLKQLARTIDQYASDSKTAAEADGEEEAATSAEERLSLTVSKSDFTRMRIIGQFNLGFILATRTSTPSSCADDELFIIDQHASDEKYNFERLQSQTIVQTQRLVHSKLLELTAIEEETILNNPEALSKNGFEIIVDTAGDAPVGQRCKVTSLPMSREVTFSISDLEELLALLGDHPTGEVPRPSKVRKMFAMRACRSSIMVGKNLSHKQMEKVVRHMGELDKPWNCPHGRPTMRHLFSMSGFDEGLAGAKEESVDWAQYLRKGGEMGLLDDGGEFEGDGD
jgi:DNA mismatch repair protein PMS2